MVKSQSVQSLFGGLLDSFFKYLHHFFLGIKYVPLYQTELDPGLEIITDDYKAALSPLQYSICVHYYHSMRIFIL